MRIFFFWILPLFVESADQSSEINCLRTNPGVLDVAFDFFHQHDRNTRLLNTTAEDIAKAVSLISSRFKRIHMLMPTSDRTMKNIRNGLSLYAKSSGTYIPLFLYPPNRIQTTHTNSSIRMYEEDNEAVMQINIDKKDAPVIGVYFNYHDTIEVGKGIIDTRDEYYLQLLPYKNSKPSSFLLGYLMNNFLWRQKEDYGALKHFQFISCLLNDENMSNVSRTSSPEDFADEVIRTCDELRDNVNSVNITAEVLCIAEYPSQGVTTEGLVGSVPNFQKFWCRIINKLVQNKSHAGIIMSSAFDLTPGHLGYGEVDHLFTSEQNTGWWRRRSFHKPGEFVEKVEELPGGKEYGKCRGPCDLCGSTNECCGELYCAPDSSIPPFEGRPPSVCRSKKAKCDEAMESISVTYVGSLSVTVLGISTFLLFTVFVAFLVYRRINANKVLSEQELRDFFDGYSLPPGRTSKDDKKVHGIVDDLPYNRQLEIHKSNFEIYENQILGSGEFGVVVKGRVCNDEVAVKTTLRGVDKVNFKALLSELKVLMHLGYHEAIVNFFGANTDQLASGTIYIFLELCPLGNLLEFLRSHRNLFREETEGYNGNHPQNYVLTGETLLRWCLKIANALEYLARKKVIHGDIAARNILVFSWDQVKLTDFGLSRRLYEYSNYIKKHQEPLPWRHMSVEALKDLSFSVQSDIWAFGVTMWELFSLGEVPYQGRSCSEEFIELLLSGLRPHHPQNAKIVIYEIMTSCWTTEVELRPSISLINSKLSLALDQLYTKDMYLNLSEIK